VSIGYAVLVAATVVLLLGAVVFAIYWAQTRRIMRETIAIRPAREGQWTATTLAGPAVITKVLDDRGWAFEIETNFRGEGVRLHYVAPSMAIARARLADLEAAARKGADRG
jgi:hypothetical protein